ncbi:hypothetical protein [Thalassorhabdomicrobium marinisediminis]|uniref:Uncharacterized protein n=1 Tax=Thalassorhabdomicrobium marinisediminis TaxID=2170577 RepID=A0A2T7G0F4_9RHOB|nr:hypothetical protein [Thalassorhabdomicrobium marinisediminis]PVA07885.1 hypothetical protein DC363_04505 [Thalassorhabdomicrobium marinisediminis]
MAQHRTDRSQLSTPMMILITAVGAVLIIALLIMFTEREDAPTTQEVADEGAVILEGDTEEDVTEVVEEDPDALAEDEDVAEEAAADEAGAPDEVIVVDDAEDGTDAFENTDDNSAVVTEEPSEGVQDTGDAAPAEETPADTAPAEEETTDATPGDEAPADDPAPATDPADDAATETGDSDTTRIVVPLTDPDAPADDTETPQSQ